MWLLVETSSRETGTPLLPEYVGSRTTISSTCGMFLFHPFKYFIPLITYINCLLSP
jgi:hypothetical protein